MKEEYKKDRDKEKYYIRGRWFEKYYTDRESCIRWLKRAVWGFRFGIVMGVFALILGIAAPVLWGIEDKSVGKLVFSGVFLTFTSIFCLIHYSSRLKNIEKENEKVSYGYKVDEDSKRLDLECVTIPDDVKIIKALAFEKCINLTSVTIGSGVESIGNLAFDGCESLTSITFKNPNGWVAGITEIASNDLSDPQKAAEYLKSAYANCYWQRNDTKHSDL